MESPPRSQECEIIALIDEQMIVRFLCDRKRNGTPVSMEKFYQRALKSVKISVANKYYTQSRLHIALTGSFAGSTAYAQYCQLFGGLHFCCGKTKSKGQDDQ